jgi:hypothetical protein
VNHANRVSKANRVSRVSRASRVSKASRISRVSRASRCRTFKITVDTHFGRLTLHDIKHPSEHTLGALRKKENLLHTTLCSRFECDILRIFVFISLF